jgi:hypothetical protein
MGPHGETLLDSCPTAATVLAGVGRWYRYHSLAGACCFAAEDSPELPPASIADALGKVRVLDQIGHPQIFEAHIPAVRFLADGHGLRCTLQWAAPAHGNAANLREYQKAIVQCRPIAKLLVGEGVIPMASLEAGIPWLLTGLHSTKEGLESPVRSSEYVLQDLGMYIVVLGPNVLDGRQLRALATTGDTHTTFAPGISAFLKCGVVQFPAAAYDERHCLLLFQSGLELVLESLAHSVWFHISLFCQSATKLA